MVCTNNHQGTPTCLRVGSDCLGLQRVYAEAIIVTMKLFIGFTYGDEIGIYNDAEGMLLQCFLICHICNCKG